VNKSVVMFARIDIVSFLFSPKFILNKVWLFSPPSFFLRIDQVHQTIPHPDCALNCEDNKLFGYPATETIGKMHPWKLL